MSKAKPDFTPIPRVWNDYQVAARFNRSAEWFRSRKAKLEKEGFPKKDGLLEGWDADAIESWFNKRSNLTPANDAESRMLEKIHA